MGFVDRNKRQDDGAIPGSGLHLDLDIKVCPDCRVEALPWQTSCPSCGATPVAPGDIPPSSFPLPHLAGRDDDEAQDGDPDESAT